MPLWDRESLLDLARGYQQPVVLAAAVELNVFGTLGRQARTATDLAGQLQADERALTMLLDALAAMELLEKSEARYRVPEALREMLIPGTPGSIHPALRHVSIMLPRWAALAEVVRTGLSYTHREGYAPPPDALDAFIRAMHNFAAPDAAEVARKVDLRRVARLLDVGGGPGTYTIAFLQAHPHLQAVLFDRPPVIQIAREHLQAAGLDDRVELVGGDFYVDELPTGCDVAWISAIIHMNSRRQNVELFEKAFRALPRQGRIIIRDHVMSESHTAPPSGALFAINMLTSTAGGGTYSFSEIAGDLHLAGFDDVRLLEAGAEMNCLVEAVKP